MGGDKIYFTEFKDNPAGCIEAKHFLISLGKWTPDLERRDGWEIVGAANKERRKWLRELERSEKERLDAFNVQDWEPYDDI